MVLLEKKLATSTKSLLLQSSHGYGRLGPNAPALFPSLIVCAPKRAVQGEIHVDYIGSAW